MGLARAQRSSRTFWGVGRQRGSMQSVRPVTRLILAALAVIAFAAVRARADQCTPSKPSAIGKKETGLLKCQSKNAAHPDTVKLGSCESKAMVKFGTACSAAGACSGVC